MTLEAIKTLLRSDNIEKCTNRFLRLCLSNHLASSSASLMVSDRFSRNGRSHPFGNPKVPESVVAKPHPEIAVLQRNTKLNILPPKNVSFRKG